MLLDWMTLKRSKGQKPFQVVLFVISDKNLVTRQSSAKVNHTN